MFIQMQLEYVSHSEILSGLFTVSCSRMESVSEFIDSKNHDSGASKMILQMWAISSGLSREHKTGIKKFVCLMDYCK